MKMRILAAVVLLPLLLVVLIALPPIFTGIMMAGVSAVAAFELL